MFGFKTVDFGAGLEAPDGLNWHQRARFLKARATYALKPPRRTKRRRLVGKRHRMRRANQSVFRFKGKLVKLTDFPAYTKVSKRVVS